MLVPITYAEKNFFSKHSSEIALELLKLGSYDNSVLLFKVLAHAVKNNDELVQSLDESIFENEELFKEKFSHLLEHALLQATKQEVPTAFANELSESGISWAPVKEFTPGELSKFFGVSVVTIHKWMDQERFVGIKRAKGNKHNYIPEDTEYITPSGKKMMVRDIVMMWHKQESESVHKLNENDLAYYTRQTAMYEEKYGGEFKKTLGAKSNLNPEEETDAQVWQHLLRRQKVEFRDPEE
ncbi:hypothetical protein [Paenibacillus sp. P36]|uniref:hypothetical protein n=1 Tax=Paenibacillus sp. P36 TaxID=3342538 RepID=UPI0038B23876